MPGDVKLVTEPEAAALATLKDKDAENSLKVWYNLPAFGATNIVNISYYKGWRCLCCM